MTGGPDWDWRDALTDGPVCVCRAQPHEHGWDPGTCTGSVPVPPLGGAPIWGPDGRLIGQRPAPPPR